MILQLKIKHTNIQHKIKEFAPFYKDKKKTYTTKPKTEKTKIQSLNPDKQNHLVLVGERKDLQNTKPQNKNYIFQQTLFNKSVWAMDETFLGPVSIFIVVNLFSGNVLGYIINKKPNYLTSEMICELINLCIMDVVDQNGHLPPILHGDLSPLYNSNQLKQLLKNYDIKLSRSTGGSFQNQQTESTNNILKTLVLKNLFTKISGAEKKTLNNLIREKFTDTFTKYIKMSFNQKASNKQFRNFYFNCPLFNEKPLHEIKKSIYEAIDTLNNTHPNHYSLNLSRKLVDFLNNLINKDHVAFKGVKRKSPEGSKAIAENSQTLFLMYEQLTARFPNIEEFFKLSAIEQRKIVDELHNLKISQVVYQEQPSLPQKLNDYKNTILKLDISLKKKEELLKNPEMQFVLAGFQTTWIMQQETQKALNDLKQENQEMKQQNEKLQFTLSQINTELQKQRKEKEEQEYKRKKYRERIKKEIAAPIDFEKYQFLMSYIGNSLDLKSVKKRIAFTILFVTGLRISEIRTLDFQKISTIFQKQRPYIKVNRLKGGKVEHKAFLTPKGREIIRERKQDFDILFSQDQPVLFYSRRTKDGYTARPYFNRIINESLKVLTQQFDARYTSHSFRRGFITQLWQDSGDIEFVRQAIGHTDIRNTQHYIKSLTDKEMSERFDQLT